MENNLIKFNNINFGVNNTEDQILESLEKGIDNNGTASLAVTENLAYIIYQHVSALMTRTEEKIDKLLNTEKYKTFFESKANLQVRSVKNYYKFGKYSRFLAEKGVHFPIAKYNTISKFVEDNEKHLQLSNVEFWNGLKAISDRISDKNEFKVNAIKFMSESMAEALPTTEEIAKIDNYTSVIAIKEESEKVRMIADKANDQYHAFYASSETAKNSSKTAKKAEKVSISSTEMLKTIIVSAFKEAQEKKEKFDLDTFVTRYIK